MSIAVICTGTELLKGGCCNTNMQLLGAELAALAQPPVMELSIGDHPDELCFALGCALKIADTVIISGGLGPTSDDITLETIATFFGLKLEIIPELKEKVEKRWALRHTGHCPKFQYKQALIVKGGKCDNAKRADQKIYKYLEAECVANALYVTSSVELSGEDTRRADRTEDEKIEDENELVDD